MTPTSEFLRLLIFAGGLLHFGILLASFTVPRVLDWRRELQHLAPLSRQLVWVHGAFVVLVILGFGVLSVLYFRELAAGTPLARGMCAFVALFWGLRLLVQATVFDTRPYLTTWTLAAGYHGLTAVFAYLTIVYAWAAFHA